VKYVFRGNAPQEWVNDDGVLVIIRPGDEVSFPAPPGWGEWEQVREPEAAEKPAKAPAEPDVVITPDGPRKPSTDGM